MVPIDELEGYHKRSRARTAVIGVLGLGAAGLLAYAVFTRVEPAVKAGNPAPDFELPLLSGGTLSSDDLKGSPVILNFWWSGCPPCVEEAPRFEAAWERYRDDGLKIVGVNVKDSAAAAQHFVDALGITYPNVLDSDLELAADFETGDAFPQTFFIDTDWRLLAIESGNEIGGRGGTSFLGAISEEELATRIEALLSER
jgi:peroxiredoxin